MRRRRQPGEEQRRRQRHLQRPLEVHPELWEESRVEGALLRARECCEGRVEAVSRGVVDAWVRLDAHEHRRRVEGAEDGLHGQRILAPVEEEVNEVVDV